MISISEGPTKLILTGEGREIKTVAHRLRYHPKGYFHSPRFKAYQLTDGHEGWDGFLSPIRFLEDDGTEADCLRGHKDSIIRIARELGFNVDTRDCLRSPFDGLVADDLPDDLIAADFELDEYQRESVAYWLKNGMGVNKIAVNGGKTAMFAAAAAMIKRRFGAEGRILYVTQSERLVRQAYKEIKGFLPGYDISQYGGSRRDNTGKDIVISTVAMLWKHHTELTAQRWFESFIAVLYDESHHVASPTSLKLMMLTPAFFRLGASDTKREKDPADVAKIRGLLGPIRYTVPVKAYIDIGRSAKPTIYIVENPGWRDRFSHLPHLAQPETPAWALVGNEWRQGTYVGPVYERNEDGHVKTRIKRELDEENVNEGEMITEQGATRLIKTARWNEVEVPVTVDGYHTLRFPDDPDSYEVESTYCLLERVSDRALIRFKERNGLIVAWTKYYSQQRKFPTLVVCTRTLHIYILESLIKKAVGPNKVQVLLGEHTSKERDRAFDWFRHTPGGVLISPLVQEGVSINEIRGGVIADYVGDWERANQIIGRFIRKKQHDNESHITWFLDNQHPALRRGSKTVLNKLTDIRGYEFCYPVQGPETIPQAKVYKSL
jgi:superfamily II DNA or RNA helicase